MSKKMKAPWVPPKGDNFKGKNTEFMIASGEEEILREAEKMVRRETVQKMFDGYYYEFKGFPPQEP